MARIAGDSPNYEFRLCRMVEGIPIPTSHGFGLPSVSTIIKATLGKPASAMSWWGFRIGLDGVVAALADGESLEGLAPEDLEELLKARKVSPNMRLKEAGDRGNAAHAVLEDLAAGEYSEARKSAVAEETEVGTRYGWAVIEWWEARIQEMIDSGNILEVRSEVPVWSIEHRYAGQLDLAILWDGPKAWEILDLKTHKPASGFTKPGAGAGYLSDSLQIMAYRKAWEEMELGETIGQRIIIARDRAYRGSSWLEDNREVDFGMFTDLCKVYARVKAWGEES